MFLVMLQVGDRFINTQQTLCSKAVLSIGVVRSAMVVQLMQDGNRNT